MNNINSLATLFLCITEMCLAAVHVDMHSCVVNFFWKPFVFFDVYWHDET